MQYAPMILLLPRLLPKYHIHPISSYLSQDHFLSVNNLAATRTARQRGVLVNLSAAVLRVDAAR